MDPTANSPPVQIGVAEASHVEACLAILNDSILGTYFTPAEARGILNEAAERRELLLALEGREVVGFVVIAPVGMFLAFPYVHLLAVHAAHRSRGIGSMLLQSLEDSLLQAPGFPGRPKVFLLVAQDNPRARRFYEAHGYRAQATLEDMFSEGDTEILMMKDLGPKASQG